MKNITKDLIQVAKIAVIAFILSVGVSYVFADWTPPQNTPPTCPTGQAGCDAPIHVGAAGQTKRGNFIIESLNSAGQVLANALVILNGKVGIGVANPTTKLQVSSSGADGILLSRDTNTTSPGVYSGRLFFQNDTTAFSLMAVRDAFEFRYGANPGTSSGVVGMYLDNAGKLTVGTTTEIVTRLDVIGRIQIRDGTQGAGKVLTSDAYGIASWTPPLTGGPGASSNIVITEFGPYRSLSKTSLGIQTYCALSNIATSRENHGARVWKEGNEWFTASINEIDAIPGYGDSRIQSFRVTCFKGDIIQGTSSGVTKIIAGTNVTVSPSNGIGDVTINASGGSGSSTPATTCADLGGTWDGTKCNGLGGGAVTISHLGPFSSSGADSPRTVDLGVHTYCALSQYTSIDDNHVGEVTQNTTTKVWTLSHQKVKKIAVVCFDGVVSGGSGSTGTAGSGVEVAQAFRSKDGGTRIVQGPPDAIIDINNVAAFTGSVITSSTHDGLQCNATQGWKLSGCWTHGQSDPDLYPYLNGCISNDLDQSPTNAEISIACVR